VGIKYWNLILNAQGLRIFIVIMHTITMIGWRQLMEKIQGEIQILSNLVLIWISFLVEA